MICPKCGWENSDTVMFCVHCHMTLRYTCPACKHVQGHGGNCDQCGVDFLKYAALLQFQMEHEVQGERDRLKARNEMVKQAILLPVTGGWSLLKYVKSALRGE